MRAKAPRLVVAAAGAIAIWSGGCGDDDATTSSVATSTDATAGAVSTEEFITAADARCAEANAAVANLSTEGSASAATIQQELDITEETLKGLKSLGSPDDPDGSLADYYAAVKQEIALLGQEQSALATGDTVSAQAVTSELEQARSDAQEAAESFGFEECGQEGAPIDGGETTSGAPASTTTAPVTPTTTAPVTPTTTAPVTPPPSGGTSGGTGTGGGTGAGGTGGGSSGGISPGG